MSAEEFHREACWHYLWLLFHNGTLAELQAAALMVLQAQERRRNAFA